MRFFKKKMIVVLAVALAVPLLASADRNEANMSASFARVNDHKAYVEQLKRKGYDSRTFNPDTVVQFSNLEAGTLEDDQQFSIDKNHTMKMVNSSALGASRLAEKIAVLSAKGEIVGVARITRYDAGSGGNCSECHQSSSYPKN